jgi:hypothetical protein
MSDLTLEETMQEKRVLETTRDRIDYLNEADARQNAQFEELRKKDQEASVGIHSPKDQWSHAMQLIRSIYRPKEEMSLEKTKAYDLLKKIGIDLYERDNKKSFRKIKKIHESLKDTQRTLEERLDGGFGDKGLIEQMNERVLTWREHASSYRDTKEVRQKAIENLTLYKQELKELEEQEKSTRRTDYEAKQVLTDAIEEATEKIKNKDSQLRYLGMKLKSDKARVSAKKVVVNTVSLYSNFYNETTTALETQIEVLQDFLADRATFLSLSQQSEELEVAIDAQNRLAGVEQVMGETIISSYDALTRKANNMNFALGRSYSTDMQKRLNTYQVFQDEEADKLAEEALTA